MAHRGEWLKALEPVSEGRGDGGGGPCPDCGRHRLEARYVVDGDSRIGYLLFWCGACLHGITVSRVRAPEGMPTRSLDDPSAVADVPDFVRHDVNGPLGSGAEQALSRGRGLEMRPEEYRARKEEVARKLQEVWARDGSVVGVLRFLVSELGPREDLGALAFGVVGCMHDAFDMSLGEAKRISRWHVVGGDLSDTEIERRFGTLVLREPGSDG